MPHIENAPASNEDILAFATDTYDTVEIAAELPELRRDMVISSYAKTSWCKTYGRYSIGVIKYVSHPDTMLQRVDEDKDDITVLLRNVALENQPHMSFSLIKDGPHMRTVSSNSDRILKATVSGVLALLGVEHLADAYPKPVELTRDDDALYEASKLSYMVVDDRKNFAHIPRMALYATEKLTAPGHHPTHTLTYSVPGKYVDIRFERHSGSDKLLGYSRQHQSDRRLEKQTPDLTEDELIAMIDYRDTAVDALTNYLRANRRRTAWREA